MDDNTGTTHVATASDHDDVTSIELGIVGDLVLSKVKLDGVVDLDEGVRVTDGAAVVGDNVRNGLGADGNFLDLQELVLSLLGGDAVDGEAALDVVEETEVFARLLDGEDIYRFAQVRTCSELLVGLKLTHEASGVGVVSADLSVDLDEPLLYDGGDLTASQGILQAIAEENGEGEGFPELMGTRGGAGSLQTSKRENRLIEDVAIREKLLGRT